jgi:hypothetical protein
MKAPLIAALALAGLAAGCGPPPPLPGEGGIPYLTTAARVIGPEALYVEAEAVHRSRFHRLERMTLVDPQGREHAAVDTRADAVRTVPAGYPAGSLAVGAVSGGPSFVGVGIGFPIMVSDGGRLLFRMRATFRVPQPAAYRREPVGWRIRLHFARKEAPPVIVDRPAPLPGI